MAKAKSSKIERRQFLTGVLGAGPALGLAGALTPDAPAAAQAPMAAPAPAEAAKRSVPEQSLEAMEVTPPEAAKLTVENPASDYMVDVIKSLDFEYVLAVPGSSFRGLQESWINYGKNSPRWVTCMHEDSSVGMADGYAKTTGGKPVLVLLHGVVGLAHAPMAIYNAFADQAPIVMIAGNQLGHSANDQAIMVRDITKWDDQPNTMQGFAESMVRAYDIATSVPMAPVLVVVNQELQEGELPPSKRRQLSIPKIKTRSHPQGESGAVREAAKWLAAAEHPVIIADRYCRTQEGMDQLVKLAELLHAPVIDRLSRLNFPNRHPLCHSLGAGAAVRDADVLLILEPTDLFGTLYNEPDVLDPKVTPRTKPGARVITIGTGTTGITKSNFFPNTYMAGYTSANLEIRGDGEATVPHLIEAIAMELNGSAKTLAEARGKKLSESGLRMLESFRRAAAAGWDASPITTARLSMELWNAIKDEPNWATGALSAGLSAWPARLWKFDKRFQAIGGQGGGGLGYSAPAAVGSALANKGLGRFTVAIVGDGDYNMQPAVIWPAVEQKLPLLMMVQNDGGYYQEVMHIQRMAGQRSRGIENGSFGCVFNNPTPNYAKIAQGYGCYAEGPISDPKELGPAIARALKVVKNGEPAFIDVVSQAR